MPTVDDLAQQFEQIEPWLLKTDWPPMTYTMIPSVLKKADQLLETLKAYDGPDSKQVADLTTRLEHLRQNFKREQ